MGARWVCPALPPGARLTLRHIQESGQRFAVERGQLQPLIAQHDEGAMLTVWRRHGVGYCATADGSPEGLAAAVAVADAWARRMEDHGVYAGLDVRAAAFAEAALVAPEPALEAVPGPGTLIELVRAEAATLQAAPDIVHSAARLALTQRRQRLWVDGVALGEHPRRYLEAQIEATAQVAGVAQTRTLGGALWRDLRAGRNRRPARLSLARRRSTAGPRGPHPGRRAELPERRDGSGAHARPDDVANS